MPAPLDAFQDLTDRLTQCVRTKLGEKLTSKLEYADPDDVLSLCMRQLKPKRLSTESLCQRCGNQIPVDCDDWIRNEAEQISKETLEQRYVQDCELVARYSFLSPQRIREDWKQKYDTYVEATVQSVMLEPPCDEYKDEYKTEKERKELCAKVSKMVFDGDTFNHLAKEYEQRQGISLDRFLKSKIRMRTREAIVPNGVCVGEGDCSECETVAIKEGPISTGDGELMAKYRMAQAIRERYRFNYYQYSTKIIQYIATKRYGQGMPGIDLAPVQDEVEMRVFGEESFCQAVDKYEPRLGRTFEVFLRRRIMDRARNVVAPAPGPNTGGHELEDPEVPGAPGYFAPGKNEPIRQRELSRAIRECLKELWSLSKGRRMWAALQLRFFGVLFPDEVPPLEDLIEIVDCDKLHQAKNRHGKIHALEELVREYRKQQRTFLRLDSEDLPEAERNRNTMCERVDACRWELAKAGLTVRWTDRLETIALKYTQEQMKDKAKNASEKRRLYLEFMMNYRRYYEARKNLLDLRADYWKVIEYPQRFVAEVLGKSQPQIAKDIKSALELLRECLLGKGVAKREWTSVDDPSEQHS